MTAWLVGYWIEKEPRDIEHSPSYYAADWETLRTRPGRYPIYMDWRQGFVCPMVGDFHVGIPSDRVAGKLYSGFCGNIFASRDLPLEPVLYCQHLYQFSAVKLKNEQIEVLPGMEWLFNETYEDVVNHCRTLTWENVRDVAKTAA